MGQELSVICCAQERKDYSNDIDTPSFTDKRKQKYDEIFGIKK